MMKRETVRVGVTGHRPGRIVALDGARFAVERALDELRARHRKMVIVTGGATGFDHLVACACVRRRIPFEMVLPCTPELMTTYWRPTHRMMLAELCAHAVDVVVLDEDLSARQVTPAVYHARNAAIVRQTDVLVAYWDGRQTGGTWWTIEHALSVGKPVYNAFAGFTAVEREEVA